MKVLQAPTEDFVKRDRTTISSDTLPGTAVVIPVSNAANFAVADYVVLGFEGSQEAELVKISARTDTSITADCLLGHKADEPVVAYRYNKRKFYGSVTAAGMFVELTGSGSPVTITVNDPQGTICEYIGGDGYLYFKATYFNSTTSEETNIADSEAVLGDDSVRYCSIFAIRKQAGLTRNAFISDGDVEPYRKRAEGEVNSSLFSNYVLPLQDSAGANVIPYVVENITVLLAAGYMDYQEFGKDGEGVKWLGEARSMLKALKTGTQVLVDAYGLQYVKKETSTGVQSYPDQVDNTNGPAQFFTMDQKF